MSHKPEKALQRRKELAKTTQRIFRDAIYFCNPFSQIMTRIAEEVYASDDYQKIPLKYQFYLAGVKDILLEQMWEHVEYSYEIDGKRLFISDPEYKAMSPKEVYHKWGHTGAYAYRKDINKLYTTPGSGNDNNG